MVILIKMPSYIQLQFPQNGVASPRTASQRTAYCGTALYANKGNHGSFLIIADVGSTATLADLGVHDKRVPT